GKRKLRTAKSDPDTHAPSSLGRRGCGFDAGRYVAHEAFETAVHLFRPHARRYRPGDEVGDAVFAHEGCQLPHAVLDIADHPGLRNAGFPRVARNAAGRALVRVEAAIDLAAIALGGTHSRPVAPFVVGHQ